MKHLTQRSGLGRRGQWGARLARFALGVLVAFPACGNSDELERRFEDPPESARPGVWWHWMGCNVTREGITRDLEAFQRAGIAMVTIFGLADSCTPWAASIANSPTDGLIAFTDPWWELVRYAAEEGRRLGIDVGIHNCPGYTSTGGPWIPPELSMQELYYSATSIQGGTTFDGVVPRPHVNPRAQMPFPIISKPTGVVEKPVVPARTNYWRDIAVLAVPAEGVISKEQVVDLTSRMTAEGRLTWTAPAGQWVIYRFGHTTMGSLNQPAQWEATGLECDKMNEEAVAFHLRYVLEAVRRHLGPLVGTGLRHVLLDSYEAGKPSWTPRMREEFARRRGYDLTPYLPTWAGRVVESEVATKRFRADFDRTIADLYRDRFFATMSRMLAEANLRFVCEPYGGPFHTREVAPYVHRVMTEFWSGDRFRGAPMNGIWEAGEGRRHSILEAEAFTGSPEHSQWTETPAGLKVVGDQAWCAGINRFVLHSCPLQPWPDDVRPGMTMGWWGTHFGRTQTWWDMGRAWVEYLSRCQALLQWGMPASGGVRVEGLELNFIHRTDGRAHAFFLAHPGTGGWALCRFSVRGMQPELWDPVRGTRRELTDVRFERDETWVPLEFATAQSWWVVFRSPTQSVSVSRANFPQLEPVSEMVGPWEVRFDPKWGGPARVKFERLKDWTRRPEPGIRYYSGTAIYRATFQANTGDDLDLGDVRHIARVRVNGQDLGVVWTSPWGVPLPAGCLQQGENVLEIEVANVWANRLIGDEQEPPDCAWKPGPRGHGAYLERFPDWFVRGQPRPSTGRYCFVTWNYFTKDSPLVPSGLLGPVRLMRQNWNRSPWAWETVRNQPVQHWISMASQDAFEADVVRVGLAPIAAVHEERVAHLGGGTDARALFNGTTRNGAGQDGTLDDGRMFRGYGKGSVLTIRLNRPCDLDEIRTFAGHADARASQNYRVLVASAAAPEKFSEVATVSVPCSGGASQVRIRVHAQTVAAIRFEFQDGPLGFNVYREINLVPRTGNAGW